MKDDKITFASLLRIAGVIETLMYLFKYQKDGRRKIEIRNDLKLNPSTATKSHRALLVTGLATMVMFKNASTIMLTKEGVSIARSLIEIRDLLSFIAPVKSFKQYLRKEKYKVSSLKM